jgi:hypothetical protein
MKRIIGCTALLFVLHFLQSCKENTILGTTLIPAVDNINTFFTDTVTMVARNVLYDSAITSKYTTTNRFYPLGCIAGNNSGDDIFGKTNAAFTLQFQQDQLGLAFPTPDSLEIDSMVLSIPFVRSYGDTVNPILQTVQVYRTNQTLSKDSNYYINQSLSYDESKLLGSTVVNFAKMPSYHLPEGNKLPQLRIKLDTNFARQIVNLKDTAELKTYAKFIEWFKGLHLKMADTNSGNILGYFDYNAAKINLYTRKAFVGTKRNDVFSFVGQNCVHHAKITRNYSQNNPWITPFLNGNNPNGDSLLFLQSDAGSTIELTFPHYAKMPNAIINKAEIEFTIVGSGNVNKDNLYRQVALTRATGINALGVDYLLSADYVLSNNGIVKVVDDGYKTVENIGGVDVYKYKLSLTKTMQRTLSEQNNALKIRIVGLNGLLGSGRSLIGGTNRISQKAKINIIYTKIK